MAPGVDALAELKRLRREAPRQGLSTTLSGLLPKRLAQVVAERVGGPPRLADFPTTAAECRRCRAGLGRCARTAPRAIARPRVTLGGVDTKQLSSKTFEARSVPGLAPIGEVNSASRAISAGSISKWAWSSGFAAGQAV